MTGYYNNDARANLGELREGRSEEEYRDIIWSQRYPTASPKASSAWPYKASVGVQEPNKLRKVK
jgi:hypothetical protein